jgi:DnaJ-class molecular chaperone
MTVENQGMPFHKKTYNNGNLIINFKIKFPAALEPKAMKLLAEALHSGAAKEAKKGQDKDVAETVQLK